MANANVSKVASKDVFQEVSLVIGEKYFEEAREAGGEEVLEEVTEVADEQISDDVREVNGAKLLSGMLEMAWSGGYLLISSSTLSIEEDEAGTFKSRVFYKTRQKVKNLSAF